MNLKEYSQAIRELEIPAKKILQWTNILREKYYEQFINEQNQGYFDRLLECSQTIVELIPKSKVSITKLDRLHAVTHDLGGPIMVIRDYTKILLAQLSTQKDVDNEYYRYLKKINSAAEYLYSLDRDILLKMMQDQP